LLFENFAFLHLWFYLLTLEILNIFSVDLVIFHPVDCIYFRIIRNIESTWPIGGVFAQTDSDDSLELGRIAFGNGANCKILNFLNSFKFLGSSEGVSESRNLIDQASQGPYICLLAASLPLYLLGRQVKGIGIEGLSKFFLRTKFFDSSEITNFDSLSRE
jgi:hypothetical protein